MAAPMRRPLLSLLLVASALLTGVSFVAPPRLPAREASYALAAGALAGLPAEALAFSRDGKPKDPFDVLLGCENDACGALGVPFLTWNLVWVLSFILPAGALFALSAASALLPPAETMLDVKAKPGYVKREFRQPGQTNPADDKAPPEGDKGMPKINEASIVTN